jgi:hypothetical protein
MTDDQRIILVSEFIEQKLRKEQELEFYQKELMELQVKISHLKKEVDLTNIIIDMIKHEKVTMLRGKHNLLEKEDG